MKVATCIILEESDFNAPFESIDRFNYFRHLTNNASEMFCFTEVVMLKDCVLKNRQSGLVGQIIFWTPPEKTLPQ